MRPPQHRPQATEGEAEAKCTQAGPCEKKRPASLRQPQDHLFLQRQRQATTCQTPHGSGATQTGQCRVGGAVTHDCCGATEKAAFLPRRHVRRAPSVATDTCRWRRATWLSAQSMGRQSEGKYLELSLPPRLSRTRTIMRCRLTFRQPRFQFDWLRESDRAYGRCRELDLCCSKRSN